jgi:hypothetical protein
MTRDKVHLKHVVNEACNNVRSCKMIIVRCVGLVVQLNLS